MKNSIKRLVAAVLVVFVFTSTLFVNATAIGADDIVNGINEYNLASSGSKSLQNWLDTDLKKGAGLTSEWYILSLAQNGGRYDYSSYLTALRRYLDNNEVYSPTSKQKYALVLSALGTGDDYIADVMDETIGKQGIMSYVFGLHLLNNGYKSNSVSKGEVVDKLLSLQLSDGGWAVMGSNSDVDVTAMVVQALSPNKGYSGVSKKIDAALSLLSKRQNKDGTYSSYGTENTESTAQVILALSALKIDCRKDGRFIKNGNTAFDGIGKFRLKNGSFSHKSDSGYNELATQQAYYSSVAYMRFKSGKAPFFILDNCVTSKVNAIIDGKNNTESHTVTASSSVTDNKSSVNSNKFTASKSAGVVFDSSNAAHAAAASYDKKTGKGINSKATAASGTSNTVQGSSSKTAVNSKDESSTVIKSQSDSEESLYRADSKSSGGSNAVGYKLPVCIGIFALFLIAIVIMKVLKKLNIKNLVFFGAVALVLIAVTVFTTFSTKEEYYNNLSSETLDSYVTLSIRCDTIKDKKSDKSNSYIPNDGVIIDSAEISFEKNNTVYDILVKAAKKYKIQFENTGGSNAYIAGINYLYEFDYGDLSGWMYFVNGKSPDVGCNSYKLKNRDVIEWLYTCDLGNDLK